MNDTFRSRRRRFFFKKLFLYTLSGIMSANIPFGVFGAICAIPAVILGALLIAFADASILNESNIDQAVAISKWHKNVAIIVTIVAIIYNSVVFIYADSQKVVDAPLSPVNIPSPLQKH